MEIMPHTQALKESGILWQKGRISGWKNMVFIIQSVRALQSELGQTGGRHINVNLGKPFQWLSVVTGLPGKQGAFDGKTFNGGWVATLHTGIAWGPPVQRQVDRSCQPRLQGGERGVSSRVLYPEKLPANRWLRNPGVRIPGLLLPRLCPI